ncbi:MAG TPA: ABC transporter permease [Candidatus Korarchaeota archaeon]|nr:ABC transporter permease [Candidatus Korarchaeota archaeon]
MRLSFIAMRAVSLFITFLLVMSAIFFLARATGDPFAELIEQDPRIPKSAVERLRAKWGLDKPLIWQYFDFIKSMFQGEFGYSVNYLQPVFDVIKQKLPWTLFLLTTSIILSTIGAVLLGAYTAWKRGSRFDLIATNIALFIRSTPHFWLGMVLMLVFAFYFPIFPLFGALTPGVKHESTFAFLKDLFWHASLPLTTLVLRQIGMYMLYMRSATLEVLGEDFIVTAKAKGLAERKVLFRHAVRNSLLPMVTVTALRFGFMVNGAILTETVFSYPGTGRLIYEAIINSDYFLLQGAFFITSVCVLIANLIADLLYAYLDPRVRVG